MSTAPTLESASHASAFGDVPILSAAAAALAHGTGKRTSTGESEPSDVLSFFSDDGIIVGAGKDDPSGDSGGSGAGESTEAFFLDVVVREGAPISKLLACKDKALLNCVDHIENQKREYLMPGINDKLKREIKAGIMEAVCMEAVCNLIKRSANSAGRDGSVPPSNIICYISTTSSPPPEQIAEQIARGGVSAAAGEAGRPNVAANSRASPGAMRMATSDRTMGAAGRAAGGESERSIATFPMDTDPDGLASGDLIRDGTFAWTTASPRGTARPVEHGVAGEDTSAIASRPYGYCTSKSIASGNPSEKKKARSTSPVGMPGKVAPADASPPAPAVVVPNKIVDVLFYRAGVSASHVGTRRYREAVKTWLPEYAKGSIPRKAEVRDIVIAEVRNWGGRFLKWEKKTKTWVEIPLKQVQDKVGQCFRDNNSKTVLNKYCSSLKKYIDSKKRKDRIPEDDEVKLKKAIDETLSWLKDNKSAEQDVYNQKKVALEAIATQVF